MPRLLALEWDQREARVAVAHAQGGEVLIEHAFVVDLASHHADEKTETPDFGARLSAALAARHIDRVKAFVAVGRANIELKLMSLPPAPATELPDLVRFQAQRQFSLLEADWPLDFISLSGDESTPNRVLAAAISAERVQQIVDQCISAEIKPRRLVLRPCAAASLLRRCPAPSGQRVRLLVDPVGEEADLTALVDNDVAFMRTVRLPPETEAAARQQTLIGEIRRTIAAAQNQLGGVRVDAIYVCSEQGDQDEWIERLESQLDRPTHVFDPFAGLQLGPQLKRQLPQHAARFAPLLGMLLDEADGSTQAIDFLHPREKPKARNNRRTIAIAASAAAILLLAVIGKVWFGLTDLDQQIATMKNQIGELDREHEGTLDARRWAAEIDQWLKTDITWLDQLHLLSEKFPESQDAMLTKLIFRPDRNQGGIIELDGVVREWSVLDAIETRIPVEAKGSSKDDTDSRYPARFTAVIHTNRISQGDASAAVSEKGPRPDATPKATASEETDREDEGGEP